MAVVVWKLFFLMYLELRKGVYSHPMKRFYYFSLKDGPQIRPHFLHRLLMSQPPPFDLPGFVWDPVYVDLTNNEEAALLQAAKSASFQPNSVPFSPTRATHWNAKTRAAGTCDGACSVRVHLQILPVPHDARCSAHEIITHILNTGMGAKSYGSDRAHSM